VKPLIRATGLKAPPQHAPSRLATTADVIKLQRLMTHALVRPLTAEDGLQEKWIDGRSMAEVAAEFIKPNDRLSAFERLQLYNRMYWFRIIDSAYDDSPGLRAVLGEKKFSTLVRAYLAKYPSRSFTLRNLCARLAQFIREEPSRTAPHTRLALDVARFEWAQTVAFDSEARPLPAAADFARLPPSRLRLDLQPYLSLLQLDYPVDDYVIAVKKRETLRGEASNAIDHGPRTASANQVRRPRRRRNYLAVHRLDNGLYYKQLDLAEFRILQALRAGLPVTRAIAAASRGITPEKVQECFATWTKLGWLCRRK
jgi:hypothetical protein